jgi:hypothetical protein
LIGSQNAAVSRLLLLHSITHMPSEGSVVPVVCGSHGGTYSALYALAHGLCGIVFNDAGIGKDGAGVAGLDLLNAHGVPAAAASHDSCRIGDADDALARGRLSAVNAVATARGVRVGMPVRDAVRLLADGGAWVRIAGSARESRFEIARQVDGPVIAADSNSLIGAEDAHAIVVTGSHGGILGRDGTSAIKQAVFAAVYNDAGIGIDSAGIGRLAPLDAMGVAAATVDFRSARIGDARSTYEDGVVSRVNGIGAAFGGRPGQTTKAFVDAMAAARTLQRATPGVS